MKFNKKILNILLAVLIAVSSFAIFFFMNRNIGEINPVSADDSFKYGYWGRLDGSEGLESLSDNLGYTYTTNCSMLETPGGYFTTLIGTNNSTLDYGQILCGIRDYSGPYWSGGVGETYPYELGNGNSRHVVCESFQKSNGITYNYVVWSEYIDPATSTINIALYRDNIGWGFESGSSNMAMIPVPPMQHNINPSIWLDGNGHPIVAWITTNGMMNSIAISYWSGTMWTDGNGLPGFELITLPPPFGGLTKDLTIRTDKDANPVLLFCDQGMVDLDVFFIKKP